MRVAAAGTATSIVRLEGLKASLYLSSEDAEALTTTGRLLMASGTFTIWAQLEFALWVQTARVPTGVDCSIMTKKCINELTQRLRGSDGIQLS